MEWRPGTAPHRSKFSEENSFLPAPNRRSGALSLGILPHANRSRSKGGDTRSAHSASWDPQMRTTRFSPLNFAKPMVSLEDDNARPKSPAKARMEGMKNRLSDIDVDLKNQRMFRQQKEAAVSNISEQVSQMMRICSELQKRVGVAEEELQKVHAMYSAERGAREAMEKTFQTLLEEKTGNLELQLSEQNDSNRSKHDTLRKYCEHLDEACHSIQSTIDEESEARTVLEASRVSRNAEKINHVSKELARERNFRKEEIERQKKELQQRILGIQNSMDREKMEREKSLDSLSMKVESFPKDMKNMLEVARKDAESLIQERKHELANTERNITQQLERESRSRNDAIRDTNATLLDIEQRVNEKIHLREQDAEKLTLETQRKLEDKSWKLERILEKEREEREQGEQQLTEMLLEEKRQREEESEGLAQLWEKSIQKIRDGLEK